MVCYGSHQYSPNPFEVVSKTQAPYEDADSDDTFQDYPVYKFKRTSPCGRYCAIYSTDDVRDGNTLYEIRARVYENVDVDEMKQIFIVPKSSHLRISPYLFEHNGQVYLITVTSDGLVTYDMTGKIVAENKCKYSGNSIYTINHVDDCFVMEIFSTGLQNLVHGLIPTEELFEGRNIVITKGYVDLPSRVVKYESKMYDLKTHARMIMDGVIDDNDVDHISLWPDIYNKIWRDNDNSPLKCILRGFDHPRVVFDNQVKNVADKILSADKITLSASDDVVKDAYSRTIFRLIEDADTDTHEILERILFIYENPDAEYEDLCLDPDSREEESFVVGDEDGNQLKITIYCDLAEYTGNETSGKKKYFVNDPKVCKTHIKFDV